MRIATGQRTYMRQGNECPKCQRTMRRWRHADEWRPEAGRRWYWFWDTCSRCKHVQHYDEAKATPEQIRQFNEEGRFGDTQDNAPLSSPVASTKPAAVVRPDDEMTRPCREL